MNKYSKIPFSIECKVCQRDNCKIIEIIDIGNILLGSDVKIRFDRPNFEIKSSGIYTLDGEKNVSRIYMDKSSEIHKVRLFSKDRFEIIFSKIQNAYYLKNKFMETYIKHESWFVDILVSDFGDSDIPKELVYGDVIDI